MVWALHAEQESDEPLGSSGWSLVAEATVPAVRLAQPGVVSKNSFLKGYSLIVWLPDEAANTLEVHEQDQSIRAAAAAFLRCMEEEKHRHVGLLGLSDRVLTLLGA